MSVTSFEFLIAALLGSGLFNYLPGHAVRRMAFAAGNLLVLWLVLPNALSWLVLGAFLASGYLAATLLTARPSRLGLTTYLVALVAVFVYLKRYTFLPAALTLQAPIQVLGLSYMLFRQIHFIIDTVEGTISTPSLWIYLNYQLDFFTLLAGPIQRYQDFESYWKDPSPLFADRQELMAALQRMLLGVVKVSLVGAFCIAHYESSFTELKAAASGAFAMTPLFGLRHYLTMFYAYPAYVYFNFSGYCDVVIAAASLFNLRLPENFDRPWLARNMIEFWTRQHITLGFWIRDYLFTPMYKAVAERLGNRAQSYAFACYFVALFLAGVWHGSTMNFVVFGLVHGAGVSITKAYETYLVKRLGRKGVREYLKRPVVRALAMFTTFHFVAFAFMFFTPALGDWWKVTTALGRTLLHAVGV